MFAHLRDCLRVCFYLCLGVTKKWPFWFRSITITEYPHLTLASWEVVCVQDGPAQPGWEQGTIRTTSFFFILFFKPVLIRETLFFLGFGKENALSQIS